MSFYGSSHGKVLLLYIRKHFKKKYPNFMRSFMHIAYLGDKFSFITMLDETNLELS